MAKVGLSAPWVQFYHEVQAMFKLDDDVRVIFDEDKCTLKLFVADAKKADALSKILPTDKVFGDKILKIIIVLPNIVSSSISSTVADAFSGNAALEYVQEIDGVFSNPLVYVVFRKEVVQYYTDNLGDIHGIRSTLYEDIAREIFIPQDFVYYCTDVEEYDLALPLGEWP